MIYTVNGRKRQATDWDKVFAKGISGEGLLPRINKELLIKTQQSEIKNLIFKMCKISEQKH